MYSQGDGSSVVVCHPKGLQVQCWKNYRKLNSELLQRRLQGTDSHQALITRLCNLGGVEGDWEEEENCPRTSPLTLTGITKGPKNRGREREVEAAREEKENIKINQIQIDNMAQEQEQGLNSASPILTMSPEVRQVHQEQAGSSEPQGNNIELMEMLRAMM